jgi:hypothetical protein
MDIELLQGIIHMFQQAPFSLENLIRFTSQSTQIAASAYNADILADIQQAWNHFVQTGQLWALIIGVIVGYIFRSITSF